MILSDLRSYLKQQHRVALADLVNHFNMDSFIKLIEEMSNRELMIELYMKYCLKLLQIRFKEIV